jgi:dephospho-CoA kinase
VKIVGLTGGIGSGKTTIAKMFEKLKVPVYYADDQAKKLMQYSGPLRDGIIALFGEKAYIGKDLNRTYIAGLVFRDKQKLKQLNALVHPVVEAHFRNWAAAQDVPYVLQESALIYENRKQQQFDAVILVTAPLETRIERVIKRDGLSKQNIVERIENQMSDSLKIPEATFVIHNTDLTKSQERVRQIHEQLIV